MFQLINELVTIMIYPEEWSIMTILANQIILKALQVRLFETIVNFWLNDFLMSTNLASLCQIFLYTPSVLNSLNSYLQMKVYFLWELFFLNFLKIGSSMFLVILFLRIVCV